jgi:hypothetical protein
MYFTIPHAHGLRGRRINAALSVPKTVGLVGGPAVRYRDMVAERAVPLR